MGRNLGPYYDARAQGLDEAHFGRWDPDSGIVTFWDYTISIPDIVAEVAVFTPSCELKWKVPSGASRRRRGQERLRRPPLAPARAESEVTAPEGGPTEKLAPQSIPFASIVSCRVALPRLGVVTASSARIVGHRAS
jgi:hypothetical protein